jgi:tetrahydromethanopterin S-methyltransferase subunit B
VAPVTGEDLKRVQNHFLEGAKKILLEHERLRPIGFVITLHKHVDKLLKSGSWVLKIIDPKTGVIDDATEDDSVAILNIDLTMDWKRVYHAVVNVFPETRDILPNMIQLAETLKVADPYKRTMRPFMSVTKLDEKDVIAASMRKLCGEVEAFASIMQSEAWMRAVDPSTEDIAKIPARLGDDAKSFEVIVSMMETYEFARMLTIPVHREPMAEPTAARDKGKVSSFGEPNECLDTPNDKNVLDGRLMRFLKPQGVAS